MDGHVAQESTGLRLASGRPFATDLDALTYAANDVGYGTNLLYYLRHDRYEGFSTFGTIFTGLTDPYTGLTDRFGLGLCSDFAALTFAADDAGYGANLFYYLRTDSAGVSTFGTISTSE